MERVADEQIEAGVEAEEEGDVGALRRQGLRVRWTFVVQGLAVFAVGSAVAYGSQSALYLVPWLAILGGLWRGAAGLISR